MTPPLLNGTTTVAARVCARGHDLTDPANRPSASSRVTCLQCRRDRDRASAKRRRQSRNAARAYATAALAPKLDGGPSTTTPNWERMDSLLLVTEPVEGPLVVTRPDGVECYRIDEWIRRFGRPPVAYTILEDDR